MAKANHDPEDSEASLVQSGVEGKSLPDVAKWIAQNGSPVQKEIAKKVMKRLVLLKAAGVKFDFKVAHVGDQVPVKLINSRGLTLYKFEPGNASMTVWVNGADVTGKVGTGFDTVLHELVHAVTMAAVRLGNLKIAQGTKIADDVGDLFDVTRAIIKHVNTRIADSRAGKTTLTKFEQAIYEKKNNAFRNENEVITWALTYLEAQNYLETIPYKGRSAWTAFVQAVRTFLGMTPKADTALSEVLRVSEALMSDNINELLPLANISGTALATQQGAYHWVANEIRASHVSVTDTAGIKHASVN